MPEKPGSYQFYDKDHTIIYVGKAKRLKSRVSSYFHTEVDRFKTKVLVSKICDITYTVVNTEEDALLLENSLIKRYNPRYNVLLKDGKTYPSICITKEYLPRIFKTRTINRKGGQYFGPYSHISSMYNILDLIGKIYKPRKCHFQFPPKASLPVSTSLASNTTFIIVVRRVVVVRATMIIWNVSARHAKFSRAIRAS